MKTHNFNRKHHLTKRKHKNSKRNHKFNKKNSKQHKKTQVKRRITRRNRKHRQTGGEINVAKSASTKPQVASATVVPSVQNLSPKAQLVNQLKELEAELAKANIEVKKVESAVNNAKTELTSARSLLSGFEAAAKGLSGEAKIKKEQQAANARIKFDEALSKVEGAESLYTDKTSKVSTLEYTIQDIQEAINEASDIPVPNISPDNDELGKAIKERANKIKAEGLKEQAKKKLEAEKLPAEVQEKIGELKKSMPNKSGLINMIVPIIFDKLGVDKIKGFIDTMFDQIKIEPIDKDTIFDILDKYLNKLKDSAQKQ